MTEIRFYHLTRQPLEAVLPVMLARAVNRDGRRAVVMATSADRVEALNAHLWTFNDREFLPHGSRVDGHAERQPVWLTESDETLNGAKVLFLTDGAVSEKVADYELVCELFDGNDSAVTEAARGRWKSYKASGHSLTYWQQNERGGWEQKASV